MTLSLHSQHVETAQAGSAITLDVQHPARVSSGPAEDQLDLASTAETRNEKHILVPASSPRAVSPEVYPDIIDDDTDSVLTALSELSLLTSVASRGSSRDKSRKRKAARSFDEVDGGTDTDTSENETQVRARKRVFRGKIRYNVPILPMSKGPIDPNAVPWPKRAPNTVAGRMQEISCSNCEGRVHWACAGFEDNDEPPDFDWRCPPCAMIKDKKSVKTAPAPQDRCIRPDCVLRGRQAPIQREGDDALFLVERIVGQKSEMGGGTRRMKYLVLWEGWDICGATWEPEGNIPCLGSVYVDFDEQAMEEGKDTRVDGVVLLREAERTWDREGCLKGTRSSQWMRNGWPPGEGVRW